MSETELARANTGAPSVAAGGSMARVARSGTANLLGAAVTALAMFTLTVVVARGVSRADAGVFFSVTSLFLVATTIGQLGSQTAIVYFISRCRALGRPQAIDAYLRAALRPVTAVAIVMMVGIFIAAGPLASLTSPGHVDQATTYLRLLALFIPIAAVELLLLSATRGLGSMRANVLIEQIARPAVQVLLVVFATLAASSTTLGIAWSIGYLPAAGAAWLAWRSTRAKYITSPTATAAERPVFREFWKFALPRSLTSIIQMLMQRFDIVLVGAMAGAVDAAIYAAATRFIVVGQLGTNALTLAAQPQFAEKLARDDHQGANRLYQVSTAWLILVTWPVYLTLILFAKPLLLVFGSGYSAGHTVILLIACSMLVATGLGMVDTVLSMAGRTSWNLGNAAAALAVNIGLDLWLIPAHGILGAAIGWAVAIVVRNVAAATQVWWSMRFHPVSAATVVAALLCAGAYVVVLGLVRIAVGDSVTGLIVGLPVATVCYLVGLWTLRMPLELAALSDFKRRGRRPASAGPGARP